MSAPGTPDPAATPGNKNHCTAALPWQMAAASPGSTAVGYIDVNLRTLCGERGSGDSAPLNDGTFVPAAGPPTHPPAPPSLRAAVSADLRRDARAEIGKSQADLRPISGRSQADLRPGAK